MCSALYLHLPVLLLLSLSLSKDVSRIHLLEDRGDVLVAAVGEQTAGDVIGDLLSLPELPGERPLPRCHHLERRRVWVLPLGRMVVGQMLGHAGLLLKPV